MFKTNFSGHNKIRGSLPPNAPRGYGPGFIPIEDLYLPKPSDQRLTELIRLHLNCTQGESLFDMAAFFIPSNDAAGRSLILSYSGANASNDTHVYQHVINTVFQCANCSSLVKIGRL